MYQRTPILTQNFQTHRWAILIPLKITIINAEDVKEEEVSETQETGLYQIIRKVNVKVTSGSV